MREKENQKQNTEINKGIPALHVKLFENSEGKLDI